jgi:hypothetical protein
MMMHHMLHYVMVVAHMVMMAMMMMLHHGHLRGRSRSGFGAACGKHGTRKGDRRGDGDCGKERFHRKFSLDRMTLHERSSRHMTCFCFLNFSAMQSFVAAAFRSGWDNASSIPARVSRDA